MSNDTGDGNGRGEDEAQAMTEERQESGLDPVAVRPGTAAASPAPDEKDAELAHIKDMYLRKHADFENFRKRTEREKTDHFKFALASVFKDLLPVLDNFERALTAESGGASEDYRRGIELIYRQFEEVLKKNGLSQVGSADEIFDPKIHEAIMRVETSEAPPNTVLEVLQRGYYLAERLLRPALVKVAVAPSGESTAPAQTAPAMAESGGNAPAGSGGENNEAGE